MVPSYPKTRCDLREEQEKPFADPRNLDGLMAAPASAPWLSSNPTTLDLAAAVQAMAPLQPSGPSFPMIRCGLQGARDWLSSHPTSQSAALEGE
jgi:hypothetical protein